jgi:hypothetical protein
MIELFETVGIGANPARPFEQFDEATKRGLARAAADRYRMIARSSRQGDRQSSTDTAISNPAEYVFDQTSS